MILFRSCFVSPHFIAFLDIRRRAHRAHRAHRPRPFPSLAPRTHTRLSDASVAALVVELSARAVRIIIISVI